jgi:antitoxin FitA
MGQVIIRNLDNAVIDALKRRAALNRRSLEQELRLLLTAAARPTPEERVALARDIRRMTRRVAQTDSTALIREDRDR